MCSFSGFGICVVLGICSSCLGDPGIPLLVVVGAQQVVSELPRFRLGFFWRFGGLRDLIRWRSCVDLRSEVVVLVGSCVDLRRTQGVLKESLVE